jgi:TonB family protein
MFPLLLCGLVVGLSTAHLQPPAPSATAKQVCGAIVSLRCQDDSTPFLMMLLVDAGISANVDAVSAEQSAEIQKLLSLALRQRVCVAGQLTRHQDEERVAQVVVRSADAITRQAGAKDDDWLPADVHSACDGSLKSVTAKKRVQPNYTAEAIAASLQGKALLELIVGTTGTVEKLRVLKSVAVRRPLGLDEEAMRAARQWTFTPATYGGAPVRARLTLEMSFDLRPR